MDNGERQKEVFLEAQVSFVKTGESKFFLFFDHSEPNISLTAFSSINVPFVTGCVVVIPGVSFFFSACSIMPSIFPSCATA